MCYWQPLGELTITKHLETTNSQQKQKTHRNNSSKGKKQMCLPRPDSRKVSVAEVWRCVFCGNASREPWAHVFSACSSERAQGSRRPWSVCHASAWLAQTGSFKHFDCTVEEWTLLGVQESLNWSSATKTSSRLTNESQHREKSAGSTLQNCPCQITTKSS